MWVPRSRDADRRRTLGIVVIEVRLTVGRIVVDRPAATRAAQDHVAVRVLEYCQKTMNAAIRTCPVNTGRLRAGHSITVRESAQIVTGTVLNRTTYAATIHNGSRTRRRRPWLATAGRSVAVSTGFLWAPKAE